MEVESLSLLGYPEHIGANAVQIIIIRMSDRQKVSLEQPEKKGQAQPQHRKTLAVQHRIAELQRLQHERQLKINILNRNLEQQRKHIQKLSLSEMNAIWDRDVNPPKDGSIINFERAMHMQMGVSEEDVEHLEQTPGSKLIEMTKQRDRINRAFRREARLNPILAQIKRGRLGFDSALIVFATLGSLALPLYFHYKFKDNKKKIVESRDISPEMVSLLDYDSPYDIDQYNYHTIHYYNPEREKQYEKAMKRQQEIKQLERDLYD